MIDFLFYLFAALAVAGALGMLLNTRNTVAGALSLVGTMVALGAIYVLLDAYLIGGLQILVYAGAIVVLFLFVVRTAGGIYVPDSAKEKPQRGIIQAVGKKVENVKVGDQILFDKYSGTKLRIEDEDCLILKEEDILGVFTA